MSEQTAPITVEITDTSWKKEDHFDGARFLHGITAYGHDVEEGNRDVMSVKFSYLDSTENATLEDLKTAKFWMYRNDAVAFAEAIIRSAKRRNSGSVRD